MIIFDRLGINSVNITYTSSNCLFFLYLCNCQITLSLTIRMDDVVLDAIISKSKIVSKYDQEILQSQTADNPMALQGRATQPLRDTRKTN